MLGKLGVKAAVTVKDTVQKKIEEERKKQSPENSPSSPNDVKSVKDLERKVSQPEKSQPPSSSVVKKNVRSEHYVSDDDETLSYDDR